MKSGVVVALKVCKAMVGDKTRQGQAEKKNLQACLTRFLLNNIHQERSRQPSHPWFRIWKYVHSPIVLMQAHAAQDLSDSSRTMPNPWEAGDHGRLRALRPASLCSRSVRLHFTGKSCVTWWCCPRRVTRRMQLRSKLKKNPNAGPGPADRSAEMAYGHGVGCVAPSRGATAPPAERFPRLPMRLEDHKRSCGVRI